MLSNKIKINYTVACVVLGIIFVLQKTVLVSDSEIFTDILDFLQWPFLIYIMSTLVDRKIEKRSLYLYFIAIIALSLFFISYINSGLANIFKYAVLIVAAHKNFNMEIFRKFRNTYLYFVITIFALGLLRIIPSTVVRRGYFTYGFIHVNVFAMLVLSIICCDILCSFDRVTFQRGILYTVVITFIMLLTDCRSVAIGYISIVMLLILFKFKKNVSNSKIIKLGFTILPIILTAISFYVAYNFDISNPMMLTLNKLSSERIYLANQLTRYFSPTLLGQDCGNLLMENSYITIFFAWGIIPGCIVLATYCYAIYKSISKRAYGVSVCLLGFAIQGLFEGSAFELFQNLALLATFII